jgi:LmbE family N-acetylglucosaminyl deacetylase
MTATERVAGWLTRTPRSRSARLVVGAASWARGGPLVAQPVFRRVVVLAPHPDDESLGPGGTLALLAQQGCDVHVVCVTDGSASPGTGLTPSEVGRSRRREMVRACELLELGRLTFLDLPDGSVARHVRSLATALTSLQTQLDAEAVFVPWAGDGHADHEAVSAAVAAADLPSSLPIWGYETWAPCPPNRMVDITAHAERKRLAVGAHVTAHEAFDVSAMLALNRYRSVHGLRGRGEAEAFLVLTHSEHRRMCEMRGPGTSPIL